MATAALSLGLVLVPPVQASQSLADLVRDAYPAIASAEGGIVTTSDLEKFNEELWLEWVELGKPVIGNGDPEYAVKLFDLNHDGKLTVEEVLRSLALDMAINDQMAKVDDGVFAVFDANDNGLIDSGEWQRALGDLGPSGDGAKKYIFERVDQLANSDGQLDGTDFAAALTLARDLVLGGGPPTGLVDGFY